MLSLADKGAYAEVGVGACDGVVRALDGGDDSYDTNQSVHDNPQLEIITNPHETRGAATEHSIMLQNSAFSPCRRPSPSRARGYARSTRPLGVVIKSLDDVACARLLEILGFAGVDFLFDQSLTN